MGKQRTDLSGKRVGRITVISRSHPGKNYVWYWLCRCDCGTKKHIAHTDLVRKDRPTRSCGCLLDGSFNVTHGLSGSPAYKKWLQMHHRIRNQHMPRNSCYRGLKVCDRWRKFENFLADMGPPPNGYTLERKNNAKGYSPSNCRWATRKEQARNQSKNRWITFNGQTKCLTEWAESLGLSVAGLSTRFINGWSPERALSTPKIHH